MLVRYVGSTGATQEQDGVGRRQRKMCIRYSANVGGAASAPIVASAFHPSLAPVAVMLAVFGYTVGTYMAWFCGQILQVINQT